MMDSRHLTLEDLGNSLLTGWPIQKIFCSSTEEKHTQQKEVVLNCQCSKEFTQPTPFVEDETHSKYFVFLTMTFGFAKDKKNQGDTRIPHLHPEALDTIRMEDLIKEYLTSKDNVYTLLLYNFLDLIVLCLSVFPNDIILLILQNKDSFKMAANRNSTE